MTTTITTQTDSTNGRSSSGARRFEARLAVRERVPLLIGLMGPSGGGKTFSALRLAVGIQRANGGSIFMVDTEARRGLHYADRFAFQHVPFTPPFSPADYLQAIEYCVKQGAGVVIVDSMSHEHEGPGGVLEMHAQEHERLGGSEGTKMLAWNKPKQQRRRLINSLLQMPCNFIFCFRAKDKVKLVPKKNRAPGEEAVQKLGFMPIAGEEFVFEMTVNCLLMPNAGGIPTWGSEEVGEKMMIKLPEQFRKLLLSRTQPLDEDIGEAMARWAAGAADSESPFAKFMAAIKSANTREALVALKPDLDAVKEKRTLPAAQYRVLLDAWKHRGIEIKDAEAAQEDYGSEDPAPPHDPETGEVSEPPTREPGSEG